jgi:hypothetical protein
MTAEAWAPYTPDDKWPWDLRRVVHLHRRAGFAATWAELQRDLKDGPGASLGRVLAGTAATTVPPDFAPTAALLGDSAAATHDPTRLKAWWVYRMFFRPDPLSERLALMWHGHFATSNLKVNDLRAMRRQNELFRTHGGARFAELLNPVVRDPAMLVWLDAQVNRKGHPNENLARELMELFTLGVGNYSETDVKEAARALTGWTVENGATAEAADRHDGGEKTILGQTGMWSGDDLVRFTLDHPATATRLAWRLSDTFLGEKVADAVAVKALADGLRQHDLDVGWGVGTILRSRLFFSAANLGTRVPGPRRLGSAPGSRRWPSAAGGRWPRPSTGSTTTPSTPRPTRAWPSAPRNQPTTSRRSSAAACWMRMPPLRGSRRSPETRLPKPRTPGRHSRATSGSSPGS